MRVRRLLRLRRRDRRCARATPPRRAGARRRTHVRPAPCGCGMRILNASGCLDALAAPEVTRQLDALVTKTVSPLPREGSAPAAIAETAHGMLNAIGLANPGPRALPRRPPTRLRELGVPLWASVRRLLRGGLRRDLLALSGIEAVSSTSPPTSTRRPTPPRRSSRSAAARPRYRSTRSSPPRTPTSRRWPVRTGSRSSTRTCDRARQSAPAGARAWQRALRPIALHAVSVPRGDRPADRRDGRRDRTRRRAGTSRWEPSSSLTRRPARVRSEPRDRMRGIAGVATPDDARACQKARKPTKSPRLTHGGVGKIGRGSPPRLRRMLRFASSTTDGRPQASESRARQTGEAEEATSRRGRSGSKILGNPPEYVRRRR